MKFSEWISEYVQEKYDGNAAQFCRDAGINNSSIYAYMGGATVPTERTMSKILDSVGPLSDDVMEDYRKRVIENKVASGNYKTDTICWNCQNAVPDKKHGCKWSRYFQPVEGWTATPTSVSFFTGRTGSFIVRECPEFIEDEKPKRIRVMQTEADSAFEDLKRKLIEQGVLKADPMDELDIKYQNAYKETQKKYRVRNKEEINRRAREKYWAKKGMTPPTEADRAASRCMKAAVKKRAAVAKKRKRERQEREIDRLERIAMGDDYKETK